MFYAAIDGEYALLSSSILLEFQGQVKDQEAFSLRHLLMNYLASISPGGINAHKIRRIRFGFDRIRSSMPATLAPFLPWAEVRPRWSRRGCDCQVTGR